MYTFGLSHKIQKNNDWNAESSWSGNKRKTLLPCVENTGFDFREHLEPKKLKRTQGEEKNGDKTTVVAKRRYDRVGHTWQPS
jgi:hypothetical protein